MDINNYSYAPTMAAETENIWAEYENENGYGKITLEQWGCNRKQKNFVVTICEYGGFDLSVDFKTDTSRGWETMKKAYEKAAKIYNQYSPDPVPCF
ncbi:MAG: hypothetical protein IJL07_10405 [Lachnospiraceae bacterium]|nr:hypothetical protein [Lachnospiraceae bacterium]